ncbi:Dfp1/Him1, central region-domain-containing protein [Xylariaceae sp. FL0016]|nr:Dfp1/Him1, central region-domain-containing protein [Xylariaceae sp. FL0016]
MSSRRVPLSSNPNVANSPLRHSGVLKQKRNLAQLQREEPYGQPPPAKKQILEDGTQRSLRSPSQQQRASRSQIPIQTRRNASSYETKLARERSGHQQQSQRRAEQKQSESTSRKYSEKDIDDIKTWQNHHRQRFPKLVFYFDKVPSDTAQLLKKQIATLGGHEAAFFSIDITHVITSRQMPTDEATSRREGHDAAADAEAQHEQEQATINPSLLTRNTENSAKRRLFDAELRARKLQTPRPQDQTVRPPKPSMDILLRAKDMGKKIWSVDKLSRMLTLLLETDPLVCAEIAFGPKTKNVRAGQPEDRNLLRLLQNERVNGHSDRDPTVLARELQYFKGPYIYIYDIEEKQKPIMVRDYNKVEDKKKGDWPQFQTAALGRCPFVEDSDVRDARIRTEKKAQAAARAAAAAAAESKTILQPPKMAPPQPATRKRSLGEMEQSQPHSRQSSVTSLDIPVIPKSLFGNKVDLVRNAFSSRNTSTRTFGGEPVASGVQPSNVTSAIRSQMISSTAATPGVVTGLSKEVHGLQRQVLKRNTSATSQDHSSHHAQSTSLRDEGSVKRPLTLGRTSGRLVDDVIANKENREGVRTEKPPPQEKKRSDMKPGYCENCQAKYADFDDHIDSKKHRQFADDDENWVELDDLLSQLERIPKHKPFPSWTSSLTRHEVY